MPQGSEEKEVKKKRKKRAMRKIVTRKATKPVEVAEETPVNEPELEFAATEQELTATNKPIYTRITTKAKRTFNITWWKAISGGILFAVGLPLFLIYLADPKAMWAGAGAVFTMAPGAFLIYWSFAKTQSGFTYNGQVKRRTGKENALVLFAKRNGKGKDIPVKLMPIHLQYVPIGSRLHYVRNWKKHMYFLYNDTEAKKLKPVMLPDKKAFPPELFKHHATMQLFKDAIEYRAPSTLQKLAPGIIILAMIVVGILMVMTVPQPPA